MTESTIQRLADRLRGHSDVTAIATPTGLVLSGRRRYEGRSAHLSIEQVEQARRRGTDLLTLVREALGIPSSSPEASTELAPEQLREDQGTSKSTGLHVDVTVDLTTAEEGLAKLTAQVDHLDARAAAMEARLAGIATPPTLSELTALLGTMTGLLEVATHVEGNFGRDTVDRLEKAALTLAEHVVKAAGVTA